MARYGTVYEDLKPESKRSLFTSVFHNIRVSILIIALVFAWPCPMAQSIFYTASALLALGWDLRVQPFEGGLLSAQMYTLDLAKLAAGAGYLVFTLPTTTQDVADTINIFEVVVFIGAIAIGMALSLLQQAIGVYYQVKELCRRRPQGSEKVVAVTHSDVSISQNTFTSQ